MATKSLKARQDELAVTRRSIYNPKLKDEYHTIEEYIDEEWTKFPTYDTGGDFNSGNLGGGSSNFMSGFFYRLKPDDVRLALKYGEVKRALLGVQIGDVTSQLAEEKGLSSLNGYGSGDLLVHVNVWTPKELNKEQKDFFERIKNGKTRALQENSGAPLIVCHGGVMRAFGALYGYDAPALFKNAHLYEFMPLEDGPFPWTVYDYELCTETTVLKRNLSSIYAAPDDPSAEEIAV